MRYFLDISYLGKTFHGWQVQKNAHTVQAEINNALSTILREQLECLGSGRTDAGVHATHQVAHFDTSVEIEVMEFARKLNSLLPKEISINSCQQVNENAHARFDAEIRSYEYHIHSHKNPFKEGLSYHFNVNLDLERINQACELIGRWKNFQSFSKVHTDVNNFDCDIKEIKWVTTNEDYVFHVSANRFLRGMVRAIVGTLLNIGQHRMTAEELEKVLSSGDRKRAGRSVPAEGLYLTRVQYPKHIYIK